jgi:hypothetical protein
VGVDISVVLQVLQQLFIVLLVSCSPCWCGDLGIRGLVGISLYVVIRVSADPVVQGNKRRPGKRVGAESRSPRI